MKKIVLFLAAVAVTLLSCSKEQDLTTNNPSPASKKVTIKVSHEATSDPQTKTALNSDNSVSWVGGETLKVVYNGGSNETSEAEAGETTHFTFVTGEGDNYLVYPYSIEASFNGTNFTVPVPATQDGTFANAAIEVAQYNGSADTCPLKNLGSLLEITVDANVDEIILHSNNSTPLVGTATVTFEGGIPSISGAVADGSTSVTLSGLDGAGTYYAAVLPGSYEAGIYVELKKNGSLVGERISGNTLAVARRQIKEIPVGNPGVIANKVFVTVGGAGNKDGSNWENAMDAAGFYSLITTTTASNQSVFMAEGTYPTTAENGVSMSALVTNLKVYGGYPSNLTGTSLAGRDITTNHTILSGNNTNRIIVFFKSGITATFDGVEFKDAYRASNKTDIGSAIVAQALSSVSFYNCTISDNKHLGTASSTGGGAVRAAAGTVLFKGCTFTGNTSSYYGGAMRVNGATVTLDNCTFNGNSAEKGGAVYVSAGTLNITNSTATTANTSNQDGGGLYMSSGSVNVNGESVFSENSSGTSGGAISQSGGILTVNGGAVLHHNASTNNGGAIAISNGTLTIGGNTVLHDNTSTKDGGALYITNGSLTNNDGACFHDNKATLSGGAVGIQAGSALTVTLANASFYANRSLRNTYCGGAMSINPNDSSTESATVSATDCQFYENLGSVSETMTIGSADRDDGKSSTGGAFYLGPHATLQMNNCKVYRNQSSKNGGAARMKGATATLFMNRCYIYDNFVGQIAAGIKNDSGILAMYNCVVYQNTPKTSVTTAGSNFDSAGPSLIANTSVRVNTGSPGIFLCTTAENSVLINNVFKNNNGAAKDAVKVKDNYGVTSYGHNIYSCWTGTITLAEGVDEGSDVKTTVSLPTWVGTPTNLLTITAANLSDASFYNPSADPDPIDYRATPANVVAAIEAFDSANDTGFKDWLVSLGELTAQDDTWQMVDIRGVSRSTSKIWPGSYDLSAN